MFHGNAYKRISRTGIGRKPDNQGRLPDLLKRRNAESFPSISLESLLNVHEYREHPAKRRKIGWMFRRDADRTFGLRDILGQKVKNTMSVLCNVMLRSAKNGLFNMAMALLRARTASDACKSDWECDA